MFFKRLEHVYILSLYVVALKERRKKVKLISIIVP